MSVCRHSFQRATLQKLATSVYFRGSLSYHSGQFTRNGKRSYAATGTLKLGTPNRSITSEHTPIRASTDTFPSHDASSEQRKDSVEERGEMTPEQLPTQDFNLDSKVSTEVDEIPLAVRPRKIMFNAIKSAVDQGSRTDLDALIRGSIHYYRGIEPNDRTKVLEKLLETFVRGRTRLMTETHILDLLIAFQAENPLTALPFSIIRGVAEISAAFFDKDGRILRILEPALLKIALDMTVGLDESENAIPPLFLMVCRYFALGQPANAHSLFSTLVKEKIIPEEALADIPDHDPQFVEIVLRVLLNVCLQRGWLTRGAQLLQTVFKIDYPVSVNIARSFSKLIVMLLRRQRVGDLPRVARILTHLLSRNQIPNIDNDVFSLFYSLARQENAVNPATQIYLLTRSEAVMSQKVFPTPDGDTCLWILRHAARERMSNLIFRLMAKDIVKAPGIIRVSDRPFLVGYIAGAGIATESRALWEHWSLDIDYELLTGDSALMIRLVSLFMNVARRMEKRRDNLSATQRTGSVTSSIPEEDILGGHRDPHVPSSTHGHGSNSKKSSSNATTGNKISVAERSKEIEELNSRIRDSRSFAWRVVREYRKTRSSLEACSHNDLNALARVYFMFGALEEGFEAFKMIMTRTGQPNIRDLNVAISGVAYYDPHAASRLIERMIAMGIRPDATSFGTIIHRALVKGDDALAEQLRKRAAELKVNDFDIKTMGALLRKTVSHPYKQETAWQDFVQARHIIKEVLSAGQTPTARMGVDAVIASLRACKVTQAFKYWQLYVKDKLDPSGTEQRYTRERLTYMIRLWHRKGSVGIIEANAMLSELGSPPISQDGNTQSVPTSPSEVQ
ncbi:hypothetical protein C8Q75DRAFT_144914 [Abortiporus biennis]|nr:hypothetical protein C8Q75DRAFT_144914 [Abortiporus biennis]